MGMKAIELKKWMKMHSKSVIDVAHETHIHFNTIYRFLSGKTKRVNPCTIAVLERLVTSKPECRSEDNSSKNFKSLTGF
jgi:hypothetical protein